MRALVTDDDAIVLESCKRILEADCFEVVLSSSVADALRILEDEEFDLVIVDVIMPENDGFYLMKMTKTKWPDIPIIAMSGFPTPEVIERGRSIGAARFISKPFNPDEFLAAVRSVLG